MSDFRFRRLERYRTDGTHDLMELSLPLPKTPSGKVYRRCPNQGCSPRLFLLGDPLRGHAISETHADLIRRGPGMPGTTCPYCGQDAEDNEFTHPQDIEAAKKFVKWAATQDMADAIGGMATEFNRKMKKSGGSLFSIEMEVKGPRLARPFPWREDLLRELSCSICGREYGVYAIALFCPDCGARNIHVHFQREIQLVEEQLDLAETAKEQGNQELAYRLLGNAHEDVLTAFETYLKTVFRFLAVRRLPSQEADKLITKKAIGNRFQNVRRGGEMFAKIDVDLYGALDRQKLDVLQLNIEKRHVVGHNLSMADEVYRQAAKVEGSGQTVELLAGDITEFSKICSEAIIRLEEESPEFRPPAK